jgi:hypothetical protein
MKVLELKNAILSDLADVNDEQSLLRVYRYLSKILQRESSDWWDDLTPEQQAELDAAIEESFHEENLVDNEVVFKKYEKWQK